MKPITFSLFLALGMSYALGQLQMEEKSLTEDIQSFLFGRHAEDQRAAGSFEAGTNVDRSGDVSVNVPLMVVQGRQLQLPLNN